VRVPFELVVGGLADGTSSAADGSGDPEDKVLWLPANVVVASRLLMERPPLGDGTPPSAA
jgi:hypothetical protein